MEQCGAAGAAAKQETARKYVLKSAGNKRRPVEVPVSQCVDRPTPLLSLHAAVHEQGECGAKNITSPSWSALFDPDLPDQVELLLNTCEQSVLSELAEHLHQFPLESARAVRVQLLAGGLIDALQTLTALFAANKAFYSSRRTPDQELECNHNSVHTSAASTADEPGNGNGVWSGAAGSTGPTAPSMPLEEFEELCEKAFLLLNGHPLEEVKVVAALLMLRARLPVFNRLSLDQRLCRLLAGHVELPQHPAAGGSGRKSASPYQSLSSAAESGAALSSSDYCTSATLNRQRMSELGQRERAQVLRRARLPGTSKMQVLLKKAQQIAEKLDFFANCSHYERRVVHTTSQRQQMAKRRNQLRLCSHCLPK